MNETPFWHSMLPHLGSAAEFAAARGLFTDAGFDYASVCRRVGAEHLYLLTTEREDEYLETPAADALDVLIRLLVIGRTMEDSTLRKILGALGTEALAALGLLAPMPEHGGVWFAPIMAHPVPGGAVMVCDRSATPEGVHKKAAPPDALYPALFQNTLDFVARFPQTPCDSLLEIGTGTGTAAIAWARLAREVWATDITPRAVHFAEFNRRLAGVENVHVVEGDLYAPVEGMTFDRIACHPPFVPAKQSVMIFRDGGEDGEHIARSIIEALPRFLRPGGLFWASFMISDRKGELAEQRMRTWLGEHEREFDIGLAIDGRQSPRDTIAQRVVQLVGTPEEVVYLGELWKSTQTEFLVHASILIRRHRETPTPAITARTQAMKGFGAQHLEWLLNWEGARCRPEFAEEFLNSRLELATACEFSATHRLEHGSAVSEQFTFHAERPIGLPCSVPGWTAKMLLSCDGSRSAREILEGLRSEGQIPGDGNAETFVTMMSGLISAGVLNAIPPKG